MVDLIEKKRDGGRLTRPEIDFFVKGLVSGMIPDYQTAAWCMAVYFTGLDDEETLSLTNSMVKSGIALDLSNLGRPTADKHSTGGVGDKTSLVLAPIVAAAGAVMAKMSGRGLGHTGGTLDKLESIPGLRTDLSPKEFLEQAGSIGLVISGQTREIVPADKQLYALRDVTGTVPSIPLIAASIMSKKLASGAGSIVLDVKFGNGALLPRQEDGRRLAALMTSIGSSFGRRISAYLTSMEQPLGRAVGNSLEVKEALETLAGGGPDDLRELCLSLAAELIFLAGLRPDRKEARMRAEEVLKNGQAREKFREMVLAQGGAGEVFDRWEILPTARASTVVRAQGTGYLADIDTAGVGRVAMRLGAGRATKEEKIDHAAGLIMRVRLGELVEKGAPMAELYTNRLAEIEPAQHDLLSCLHWAEEPPGRPRTDGFLERLNPPGTR